MNTFPLIRSQKSAAVGTLLVALPMILLTFSPLAGLYAVMLYLFAFPIAVCIVGMVCGIAPMAVDAAAGIYALYRLLGVQGAGLGLGYLVPILIVFFAAVGRRVPFWKGCAYMIGAYVAAFACVFLMAQRMAGGQLYTLAGDQAMEGLKNWELGDTMLYQIYSMGLIGLPDSLKEDMVLLTPMGYALSEAARQDMLLSVRSLVISTLSAITPTLIAGQSIMGGVMCLFLPLRFGFLAEEKRAFRRGNANDTAGDQEKRSVDFPDLGVPPLSQWHLPRGLGWQVGAVLVVGYLLSGSAGAVGIAGSILYAAALAVFQIQGAALINFMQKIRNVRRGWRVAVPILLMMASLLSYIGIFDQIVNIRRLRKPREPREE